MQLSTREAVLSAASHAGDEQVGDPADRQGHGGRGPAVDAADDRGHRQEDRPHLDQRLPPARHQVSGDLLGDPPRCSPPHQRQLGPGGSAAQLVDRGRTGHQQGRGCRAGTEAGLAEADGVPTEGEHPGGLRSHVHVDRRPGNSRRTSASSHEPGAGRYRSTALVSSRSPNRGRVTRPATARARRAGTLAAPACCRRPPPGPRP